MIKKNLVFFNILEYFQNKSSGFKASVSSKDEHYFGFHLLKRYYLLSANDFFDLPDERFKILGTLSKDE